MASILTPQIATLLGYLDSDAFADGGAYGAHVLRALSRNANRLVAKVEPLFGLWWPSVASYTEHNQTLMNGVAPLSWVRVLPEIPAPKVPGHTMADLYGSISIPSGEVVELYVGTSVRPWRPGAAASVVVTGTGSWQTFLVEDVPIAEGPYEVFELWLRGRPTSSLANTGTYGSPNTRSAVAGTFTFDTPARLQLSAATWNTTAATSSNLATGGHLVRFLDSGTGADIVSARTIVSVNAATILEVETPLSQLEQQAVLAGDEFEIYTLPTYSLANFGAHALARTE